MPEGKQRDGGVKDEVVLSLMNWGTSPDFEEDLADWMADNCTSFKDVSALNEDGSHRLECGAAFDDYSNWLDKQLESFCEEAGLEAADVTERMQRTLEEHSDEEFFPAFMSLCDFAVFAQQLHQCAVTRVRHCRASMAAEQAAANEDGEAVMNISGTWVADPATYDPEGSEAILAHLKCPWVFRKVLKRAARFIKDISIEQGADGITFTYTVHLFGTTVNKLRFAAENDALNLWGKPTTLKFEDPRREHLQYTTTGHPKCPEGTYEVSTWAVAEGGRRLVWIIAAYRPDLEKEVVYRQEFVRKKISKK